MSCLARLRYKQLTFTMAARVEQGKDISVLVEQAFPTCILVSFQHGEKTFRGVLLDESNKTAVIRANPLQDMAVRTENLENLGLTTARTTTCQSDMRHIPSGRVNTRSSAMMLQGGGNEGCTERITPVHKIRGLVESLSQRSRRLNTKAELNQESNSEQAETTKETNSDQSELQPSSSPVTKNRNATALGSAKRKRCAQNSEAFMKPTKTRNTQPDKNILNSTKPELNVLQIHSPLQRNTSPLFPVIKLKKTSKLENSYVVTMLNKVETGKEDGNTKNPAPLADSNDLKPADNTDNESIEHRHNTRFRARKLESTQQSEPTVQPTVEINHKSATEEIPEKNLLKTVADTKPKLNTLPKRQNSILLGSSKYRRQLNTTPIRPVQDMKVGDIAWGKVHGHPWWPCRVLGILCDSSEDEDEHQVVKVSWYGSPTTSVISCRLLRRFKEHFKHLFRKQKKGAYKLAVRQAQQDIEVNFDSTQVIPIQ